MDTAKAAIPTQRPSSPSSDTRTTTAITTAQPGLAGPQPLGPPAIQLPRGGGAIRGLDESFSVNAATGSGSLSLRLPTSPGRDGFGPQLSLIYDSGAGNGPYGLGWNIQLGAIQRKTENGLPRYVESGPGADAYVSTWAADLVATGPPKSRTQPDNSAWQVQRYRPRIEGGYSRIERWTPVAGGPAHWRSISREGITSLFGTTQESRIADPANAGRVFSWLISESYDMHGNAMLYCYASDDSRGVDLTQAHERNRSEGIRGTNRYLKRILYANAIPRMPNEDLTTRSDWLLEFVLDYGDHDQDAPTPAVQAEWVCRNDPFSSYRPGFELRTYRLCHRFLMFHHFPEPGVGKDCLVSSLDLAYDGSQLAAKLVSATQNGFRRIGSSYLKRALPPLEFEYTGATLQPKLQDVVTENVPQGIGSQYEWIDLDGEGLSGVLIRYSDAWYYKRNVSPLNANMNGSHSVFGPLERIRTKPSTPNQGEGVQQFMDVYGDGRLGLAELDRPVPGFYSRTSDGDWELFRPFTSVPNLEWRDPNLRMVDLTGDGHADVLVTDADELRWYHSLAELGFGGEERVSQPHDEEQGPRLVFADTTQSVYLADLSGDGLSDLVRVRNGEICYWPNCGYGRFGAKITMDGAPWFDSDDLFDERRVRFADVDGSGPLDLIYLGRDGIRWYANESGNRWSPPHTLANMPRVDDPAGIAVVDLLGNGTACVVWSSSLSANEQRPLRFVDLFGGTKPHLLVGVINNLGAETRLHYAASTKFYVEDRAAGRQWITRLPFPVHVVDRVETYDYVSRNRFVTRYAYHHGYFDSIEREFRGFGLVEQWDTEELAALTMEGTLPAANIAAISHVPPILIRTWFHTGADLGCDRMSRLLAEEYYREGNYAHGHLRMSHAQAAAMELDDTILPTTILKQDGMREPHVLSPAERREAARALKGSLLRQEIYAQDGTDAEGRPYSVIERNYSIELLQARCADQHASFAVLAREEIDFLYDRALFDVAGEKAADPRVTHTLILNSDAFGNVLRSASVAYGRRFDDPAPELTAADRTVQRESLLTYTELDYTNTIDTDDAFRTPVLCQSRTYDLLKVIPHSRDPAVTNLFRFDELRAHIDAAADGAHDVPSEDVNGANATQDHPYRRLVTHHRTLFRRDNLSGPLPLGTSQPMALVHESYRLTFTAGLLATRYARQRPDGFIEPLLPDPTATLGVEAGYVRSGDLKSAGLFPSSDHDDDWWQPSGRQLLSPAPTDEAAAELAFARAHFFAPVRYVDPFGAVLAVRRDSYDLLVLETRDAMDNRTTAGTRLPDGTVVNGLDYRVLQPRLMMDANGNLAETAFDALGMAVGTAFMGKPGEHAGDSLMGFDPDPPRATVIAQLADPLHDPLTILSRATTRLIYDPLGYADSKNDVNPKPVAIATLMRETHDADLAPGHQTRIQHTIAYSDGFGREVQKKIIAEPGPTGAGGSATTPRWVGTGWTIFDNKGHTVRQYEPFFSTTSAFEFASATGVSPILCYDPLGRLVARMYPNHSYDKTVFSPWRQMTWDVNDTVAVTDPRDDPDVGPFFRRLPGADYLPTWNGERSRNDAEPAERAVAIATQVHANTPSTSYVDPLGRPRSVFAHNRVRRSDQTVEERLLPTRRTLDVEGNERRVADALTRVVNHCEYDLAHTPIHIATMDAGERWILRDATGKSIREWDSRGYVIRTRYDQLRRPIETFVRKGSGPELLRTRIVYGETEPTPERANLRGRPRQIQDLAGIVSYDSYDFRGNLERSSRRLLADYRAEVNWAQMPALENETFQTLTRHDALNRPTQIVPPHTDLPGAKLNVIQIAYSESNALKQIDVWLGQDDEPAGLLDPASKPFQVISNIDYNAKGQRTRIAYGNGAISELAYEPRTFRLSRLITTRPNFPTAEQLVQDLRYTYDPAGNITRVGDNASQTIFFAGNPADPSCEFSYDALYRLVGATSREYLGGSGEHPPRRPDPTDSARMSLGQPGVADAMRRYSETYAYDDAGNMLELAHHSGGEAHPDWTRIFQYEEPSRLDPAQRSNRLTRTQFTGQPAEAFSYDENGNVTVMPHLPSMRWDERNRLQATTPPPYVESTMGTTHYRYDIAGQRVRKVTEREASGGQMSSRGKETIYLADVEIRREYQGDGVTVDLERETLHIEYGGTRFALIETRIHGEDGQPDRVIRFQHENQVESSVLELGENAQVLSLEEYYPYGLTSFVAVHDSADPPKRYRYTGKERDSESSLYYHGARYYVPWLARWTSVDPLYLDPETSEGRASRASGSPKRPRDVTSHGFSSPSRSSQPGGAAQAHTNPYVYVDNRPVVARDPDGKDAVLIAYPDFRPEIPHVGRPLALGHAGILLIDNKTGLTKYYEYGRYDKADLGLVRTQTVPNVVIRDGRPTPESLNAVLSRLSTVAGHGGRIRAAYIESSQFDEMDRAAQAHLAQNSNPHRKPYAITDNNCATFGEQIARTDPGVAHPWLIINTSPNNIVDEYIEEGHREINFTPTSSSHAPSHRATPKGKPHTTPSQAPGRPPQHGPQHKGVHQIPAKPTKPIHR